MKIKLTSVYVDDQDKALRFYTEVLGFAKKADFSQGPYRWLTVTSPEDPDGTELQLALNNDPAAKTYQQARLSQHQPAAMFFTDDIKGEYERLRAHGAGAVSCWGSNENLQLGIRDRALHSTPVRAAGASDAIQIAASDDYTCLLRKSGEVVCWGTMRDVETDLSTPINVPPVAQVAG